MRGDTVLVDTDENGNPSLLRKVTAHVTNQKKGREASASYRDSHALVTAASARRSGTGGAGAQDADSERVRDPRPESARAEERGR